MNTDDMISIPECDTPSRYELIEIIDSSRRHNDSCRGCRIYWDNAGRSRCNAGWRCRWWRFCCSDPFIFYLDCPEPKPRAHFVTTDRFVFHLLEIQKLSEDTSGKVSVSHLKEKGFESWSKRWQNFALHRVVLLSVKLQYVRMHTPTHMNRAN